MSCPICNRKRSERYENPAAGEACVDPCHWPYLSALEVSRASMALDRIERSSRLTADQLADLNDVLAEQARDAQYEVS